MLKEVDFDRLAAWTLYVSVVFILLFVAYCGLRHVTATGEVEFCYIEYYSQSTVGKPTYTLKGFRDWRPDVLIGTFDTFEDATKGSELVHCPLQKKK